MNFVGKISLILLLALLTSCGGGKSSKSTSTHKEVEELSQPDTPTPIVVIEENETTESEAEDQTPPQPKLYDLSQLQERGIHILGKSNLMALGNPPVIYCSNTPYQNIDKVEELQHLEAFIQQDYISIISLDQIKLEKVILMEMIKRSISLLESSPYSHLCPQIYLSI